MATAAPLLNKEIQKSSNEKAGMLEQPISVGFNTHLLVEMWHAPFSSLADAQIIGSILEQAGSAFQLSGREKIKVKTFQFNPYGVSGTATNSTIHILIHTWPENEYAALDIFARGHNEAHAVLDRIKAKLNPGNVHVMELARGKLLDLEDT